MKCKICNSHSFKKIDEDIYVCQVCGVEYSKDELPDDAEETVFNENTVAETSVKENKKKKLSSKKLLAIGLSALSIVLIVIAIILFSCVVPMMRYNKAIKFINNSQYNEAYSILTDLGDYKDSISLQNKTFLHIAEIGDVVKYGKFEQDNNMENGAENIDWYVIDKKDGQLLLLSKYCIAAKKFDSTGWNTWDYCELRNWLNKDFHKSAFSEQEKNQIRYTVSSNIINFENNVYAESCDKVFLLSDDEVKKYLNREQSIADSTLYARKRGAAEKATKWFTRTKVADIPYYAVSGPVCCIDGEGNIDRSDGYSNIIYGVRPAIWITLDEEKNEITAIKKEDEGTWDYFDGEVTISEVTAETVKFDYFFYRIWSEENIVAQIKDDGKAYFVTESGTEGCISIYGGDLLLEINKFAYDIKETGAFIYKKSNNQSEIS